MQEDILTCVQFQFGRRSRAWKKSWILDVIIFETDLPEQSNKWKMSRTLLKN